MSNRTSRRSKVLGVALSAATLGVTFTAFAPSAGADLAATGDADIRVLPALPSDDPTQDNQDQNAPIIFADELSQPGADLQLGIPNQWDNNDRILLAVANSNGDNCTGLDPAEGALAYASEPTLAVDGPYDGAALLASAANDGSPNTGGVQDVLNDPAVATPAPNIQVSLTSSTRCAGTANDVIELRFVGASAATADPNDAFILTLSDIAYDVARLVPAGPIHNVPYGENSTGALTWEAVNLFDGNMTPGTPPGSTDRWTNGAFVSPVTAMVGAPSQLIDDGTRQALGTVTISEIQEDAFLEGAPDTLSLTFSNLNNLSPAPDPVVNITDKAGAQITTVNWVGNRLDITYDIPAAPPAEVLGSITIDGLHATPTSTGPISLTIESPHFDATFFTPDDQTSNTTTSDVNLGGPLVVENFAKVVTTGTRIGGNDRYETAANIAYGNGCSNFMIVASGEDFADALSANYLAGALADRYGDPASVLLTRSGELPDVTASALRFLGARQVYVIGGPNAVSDAVVQDLASRNAYFCTGIAQLSDSQLDVTRLAGANRYATNNRVTEFSAQVEFFNENRRTLQTEFGAAGKNTALLATGASFADALTAGPLAVDGLPLILTASDSLSPQALQSLNSLDIDQVIVLGGTSAVSQSVQDAVAATGRETFRIAGDNRFETATATADFARTPFFPTEDTGNDYDAGLGFGSGQMLLSNGNGFADALAGGTMAGYNGSNIVLTGQAELHAHTETWLEANAASLNNVRALGLGAAVSTAALDDANAAIS